MPDAAGTLGIQVGLQRSDFAPVTGCDRSHTGHGCGRSHGEHGRMPVATEALGNPGLRAILNSDNALRTIFGLGERRFMRCCRRIAMLELTLASRTDASNR
jgi:hypothetical protein